MKLKQCFPETVSSLGYKKLLEDVTTDNNLPVSIIFMCFRMKNLIDELGLQVSKTSCRFPFAMAKIGFFSNALFENVPNASRYLDVSQAI